MTATLLPMRPGLGRHIEHDPRSLRFAAPVLPRAAIRTAAWKPGIGILDQGDRGKCVAESGVELLSAADAEGNGVDHVTILQPAVDWMKAKLNYTAFAVGDYPLNDDMGDRLYAICTRTDDVSGAYNYPPGSGQDTGSTGLGLAKALVGLGLAESTYQHAFTVQAIQTGLQERPVPIGVAWFESMFDPQPDGRVVVDPNSGLAGGHEIVIFRYDLELNRFWFPNHWGRWGVAAPEGCGDDQFGWGYFTGADMTALMSSRNQGDATVIRVKRAVAPEPQPPQPSPPQPGPVPGGGASFPGSTVAVDTHIAAKAREYGLSVTDYQNHHWTKLFHIKA